jgi:MFS transporter, DHA1 family, multidrug resistance protein
MEDIIREAPLGQLIRLITRNKFLKYPEEKPDFVCPNCYRNSESADSLSTIAENEASTEKPDPAGLNEAAEHKKDQDSFPTANDAMHHEDVENLQTQKTNATVRSDIDRHHDFEKLETAKTNFTIRSTMGARPVLTRTKTREMTRAYTQERFDIEREEQTVRELNLPIIAQKTEDGDILVDWYTTDDPANPQNWSSKKKIFAGTIIL